MRPSYRRFGCACAPSAEQIFSQFPTFRAMSVGRRPQCLDDVALQCHIADHEQNQNVCVYCGSGPGTNPHFVEAATDFGKILAENRISLVYGGGSLGLMGAIADIRAGSWRHRHRHHPGIPGRARARSTRVQEMIVTPRHARAQAADVRALGCLRRPARRHRHAGGTGRAADLGAARRVTPSRSCSCNIDSSGSRCSTLLTHMRARSSSDRSLAVNILKAERVEDILPTSVREHLAADPPKWHCGRRAGQDLSASRCVASRAGIYPG